VSFNTPTTVDNPYIYVTGPNPPLMVAGQTISAYIYLPDNSTGISADFSLQSQRSSWYDSATTPLTAGRWNRLTYIVPSLDAPVSTLGIDLYCSSNMGKLSLYIDDISVN